MEPRINPIMSMFNPVSNIKPLEGGTSSKGLQRTGTVNGGNSFAGFELTGINGELIPTLGNTGSSYTTGVGHSEHTINCLA